MHRLKTPNITHFMCIPILHVKYLSSTTSISTHNRIKIKFLTGQPNINYKVICSLDRRRCTRGSASFLRIKPPAIDLGWTLMASPNGLPQNELPKRAVRPRSRPIRLLMYKDCMSWRRRTLDSPYIGRIRSHRFAN